MTRRDLLDIVEQLEFIHGANYVHCDVANRNMVQFVESDGTQRSVLIDFGAAIKHGATSLGGTVYNVPVWWLETNWRILSSVDARVLIDKLTPLTAVDDLVCFAWAKLLADHRTCRSHRLPPFLRTPRSCSNALSSIESSLSVGHPKVFNHVFSQTSSSRKCCSRRRC